MPITVISQNTEERQQETIDLFNQCKPYLKQGMKLVDALQIIKHTKHNRFYNQSWYRELKEYAESQGYQINKRW